MLVNGVAMDSILTGEGNEGRKSGGSPEKLDLRATVFYTRTDGNEDLMRGKLGRPGRRMAKT